MNLTLNTKKCKLCYISWYQREILLEYRVNISILWDLLMILKLNFWVVKQAKWKDEFQIIPSNFCERIVTHLEVSKTEVERFITRIQIPRNRRKDEAVGHVFSNETIKNDVVTIFLFRHNPVVRILSLVLRETTLGTFHFRWKTCFISEENLEVFYLVFR